MSRTVPAFGKNAVAARVRALVVACVVGVVGVVGGCADDGLYGTCVDDGVCADGTVCAFGACVDANDPRLAAVDLEIQPVATSGLPTQPVFDIDAASAGGARIEVVLENGITMGGTVTNQGGTPVPAQLQARPPSSIPGRLRLATAATDERGAFTMTVLDDGGDYDLSVLPDDRDYPPRELDGVSPDDDLTPIVLDEQGLTAFVHLQGRVIAGVGVQAEPIEALELRVLVDGRRVSTLATTDGDGFFDLVLRDAIPPGATLEVQPATEEHTAPSLSIPLDAAAASGATIDLGDLSLGPTITAGRVSGVVVDERGAPVRGATVTFRGLIGGGTYARSDIADDDGVFGVSLLPGDYTLAITAEPTSRAGLLVQDVSIPANGVAGLSIVVPDRVPVDVVVTTNDGVAMAAGSVTFQRVGDVFGIAEPVLTGVQPSFTVTADVDGRVELSVDQGRYRVNIQPPRGTGAPSFSTLVTVDGGLDRSFVLPPQNVLAGRVVDDGGSAAPGAFVRVFSKLTDEQGRAIFLGEAVCADDGTFAVSVPDLQ